MQRLPRLSLVFWIVSIFPDFFVRGLAILGPQRVCRLVLSLVGRGRGLISRNPGWRLELGHGGVGKAIIFGEMLISSHIVISVLTKGWCLFWKNQLSSGFCPIVNFDLLVLGVLSNATSGNIYKGPWVAKTLSKESLKLDPRQRSHSSGYEGTKLQTGCGWSPWRRRHQNYLCASRWPTGLWQLAWAWRNESMQNLLSSKSLPRCTWWKPEFFYRDLQACLITMPGWVW